MQFAPHRPLDFEGLLVERLRLRRVSHRLVERREVVQVGGIRGMLLAQHGLVDVEGLEKERLGFRSVAPRLVEHGEVVEASGIFGMLFPENLPVDFDGLPVERFRLRRVPQRVVQQRQIVEAGGVVGMLLAQHSLADLPHLVGQHQGFARFSLPVKLDNRPIEQHGLIQLSPVLGGKRLQHIDILQGPPRVGRAPVVRPAGFHSDRQHRLTGCSGCGEVLVLLVQLSDEVPRAKYLLLLFAIELLLDGQHLFRHREGLDQLPLLTQLCRLLGVHIPLLQLRLLLD